MPKISGGNWLKLLAELVADCCGGMNGGLGGGLCGQCNGCICVVQGAFCCGLEPAGVPGRSKSLLGLPVAFWSLLEPLTTSWGFMWDPGASGEMVELAEVCTG